MIERQGGWGKQNHTGGRKRDFGREDTKVKARKRKTRKRRGKIESELHRPFSFRRGRFKEDGLRRRSSELRSFFHLGAADSRNPSPKCADALEVWGDAEDAMTK